jgi:hypothetical protein
LNNVRLLLIYLLFSVLLLEYAIYALIISGNQLYLLSVFICTISIVYITFHVCQLFYKRRQRATNYHLYFVNLDNQSDTLFRKVNERM